MRPSSPLTTKGIQHNSFGNEIPSLVRACLSVVFSGGPERKVWGRGGGWGGGSWC